MIARIHKSMQEKDKGFTLIELLVVMIIIGILAAIAIPVFLNQRKKAQDSATKADASTIGKEIATYFVDNTNVTSLTVTRTTTDPARWNLSGGALTAAQDLGRASDNVALVGSTFTSPTNWSVTLTNPEGTATFRYSATGGLEELPLAPATP